MFSILFPGQGSQFVGMANEFYENFSFVKEYFSQADDLLKKKISKIILDGPKEILDETENTQPAIFLVSYSLFKVIEKETNFDIKKANYFAGHSLGEYSALCCAGSISFEQTLKLLDKRGKAMQNSITDGRGGMVAVLGTEINEVTKIINDNLKNFTCYIANDNSDGQIVVSGKISCLDKFSIELKKNNIKFVKLSVSAPFHCPLMGNATNDMKKVISDTDFKNPYVSIISNVTAKPVNESNTIKKLLIEQIEKPVRWRESVKTMISQRTNKFIELGPGKVLSGLVKRIDRNVQLNQINNLDDIKILTND